MKIFYKLILVSLVGLLLASCAKESDDSTTAETTYDNALVNSASSVTTSSAKLADLMADSSSLMESRRIVRSLAPTWWDTTTSMNNDITNSGQVTPMSWMGTQLDEDAVRDNGSSINVFGRLKGELGIFCTVGMVLGTSNFDANGYPENGTYSAEITAALSTTILSTCGLDTGGQAMTVPITVSDAGGSIYEKKLVITPPGSEDQTIFIKMTSTEVKIASSSGSTQGSTDYGYKTIIDITDGVLKVEYVSIADDEADVVGGDAVAYFHRLYYNDSDNIGVVGSFIYGTGTSSADNAYILAGDPDAASPSFSLTFYDSAVNGAAVNKVCVDGSDGTITDDSNHCGGSDIANYEFPSDTASAFRDAWGGNDGASGEFYDGANYQTVSNATSLSFTDESDVKSALFSQN
jgi:hypothetical protein